MKEADFKNQTQIYVPLANVTNHEECNKFAYPLSRGQIKKSAMKGYAPVKNGYIKKGRIKVYLFVKKRADHQRCNKSVYTLNKGLVS